MTTKFSPGDRVRVFERSQQIDGTVDGIWPDGTVRVKLDAGTGLISYHPKQMRRLVKRRKVVWESRHPVQCIHKVKTDGCLDIEDAEAFSYEALGQFLGSRVRIVITEARGKK